MFVNILRFSLWLRYRITIKGYENLTPEHLKKAGGVLFLPNHTALFVDPAIITYAIFRDFPIRPLITEYMYFKPVVYNLMKMFNALPVPDFESSNNRLKRKRNERVISEVIHGLKSGENFLIYPSGRLKHTSMEKIGGASATHRIIQETPEANVVLIRIKGLWGSSFSRALTGEVPPLFETIKQGIWTVLKNLIFFTPRREVIVEFMPAPTGFPYKAGRIELNKWLENWYNRPDGLSEQAGKHPGESLVLTSYSMWREELAEVHKPKEIKEQAVELVDIDVWVQDKVLEKLEELTERDPTTIRPNMDLASDLGLDSLDKSEMAVFLQDEFNLGAVPVTELTTVTQVMGIAAKKIELKTIVEEEETPHAKWEYKGAEFRARVAEGETMPEVFLNICDKMGSSPAYADMRSGVLPYSRLKIGAILLAEHIRHLPGKYIGIMLPASVGAMLSVIACQLAGKVPLMLNWTIGAKHLEAVRELSGVQVVLTSWAFLERLDDVNLDPIEDLLVMLETVKYEFSLVDKIRALIRSKRSHKSIMKTFGIDTLKKDDTAVLLFTSGTEALPKGVPLTYDNILANQRAALDLITVTSNDVILSFLPPFHSFGFCLTGLLGLFSGIRTAFFPNPTDGAGLAKAFENWDATIACGAPTFLKALLKAASPGQLERMNLCISGAEKTPPDLIDLLRSIGKEECIMEGYGATECSPILTVNLTGKPDEGVGKPLPGVELLLVHTETHEPVAQGTEGLVLARGPNIFSGYINPGQASPFITVEGEDWYNTGDIGFLDEEERLHLSGRMKRFLKVGGEMVSLLAIESTILEEAHKRGWPINEEGPALGIIARENPGSKPLLLLVTTFDTNVDEINGILQESGFTSLIRVADVIKIPEIPIMGTGKMNYRLMEEQYFKAPEEKELFGKAA